MNVGRYLRGEDRHVGTARTTQPQPLQRTEQEPTAKYSDIVSDGGLDPRNKFDAQVQRKPLTNGEIYTAYITATNQTLRATDERLAFAFARAIEAAHGIKENT